MFRTILIVIALLIPTIVSGQTLEPINQTTSFEVKFQPTDIQLANPERGFWRSVSDDFLEVYSEDFAQMRKDGLTMAYALVRLDKYRNKLLPADVLEKLAASFGKVRKGGIKVKLRFAYNYPQSSSEYDNAKDAPLDVVLRHIEQLGPVINENKDVLVVMQAGFIGAWGEGHTSSNGLDSDENKIKIRDALLAALDPSISIQFRYPPDILAWKKADKSPALDRIAFHNDCFLSSPTDVGTYSEDKATRLQQREAMKQLTGRTYFSGETCDAEKTQIRNSCDDILAEGAQFHVSSLGIDYYEAFHKAWRKQGCFNEVTNKMGYRFVLRSAVFGENGNVTVTVANDGWARAYKTRPWIFEVFAATGALLFKKPVGDLSTIEPNQAAGFSLNLTTELAAPQKVYCLSAPDADGRLDDDPRYSIRFANADVTKLGQKYDEKTGKFCFLGALGVEKSAE